jgi:5-methylcytosine-specific restriction endonuclease McrA
MYNWETFKQNILVEDLRTSKGLPRHTRLAKKLFYKFSDELLEYYGFDMHTCSCCGIKSNNWQGKDIVIELDHINGITNDSRIENLRMLCPNCHSQTPNYKNRKNSG